MDYEKIARNLRGQAVLMTQNCRGPVYERSGVIRALKEGADAIEELLREKASETPDVSHQAEGPDNKSCLTCSHFDAPNDCAPCKDCVRVHPGTQDYWEKDGDL